MAGYGNPYSVLLQKKLDMKITNKEDDYNFVSIPKEEYFKLKRDSLDYKRMYDPDFPMTITYKDGTIEGVDADSIGAYSDNGNLLVAFKDDSEVPVGFFNVDSIRSIRIKRSESEEV